MEQIIEPALKTLREGGLILYPTDTVWGIGCDATDTRAIDRIYRLKQRDDRKSLIILLADDREIGRYTAQPHPGVFEYLRQSERPTTVIYEDALGLPDNLVHEDRSIAIRVTRDPFCKALIKRLRRPLVSTSANISGAPSPAGFRDIDEHILRGVDHVVDYRREETTLPRPSRIVRFRPDGSLEILRD